MTKFEFQFDQISGNGKYEREDSVQLTFEPIGGAVLTLNNTREVTAEKPFKEEIYTNEQSVTDYDYKITPTNGVVLITKKTIRN